MSALISKDLYVLIKQMGIFLVIILVLTVIPGSFNNVFAIVYGAMLPYTAMAYDERSKWDQMAAVLPYSDWDIVLSKYVLGWLCVGGAALLTALIQGVLSVILVSSAYRFSPALLFLALCAGVCILAVTLPLMFRFGVEKGRLAMFFIIFLVCGASGALTSVAISGTDSAGFAFSGPVLAVLPLLAVGLTAASVPLSLAFHRRRKG